MRKIVQHLALSYNKMLTFDHHLVKILTKNSFGDWKEIPLIEESLCAENIMMS